MNILISACLMGLCTRYDGGANPVDITAFAEHTLIPVCPEQLGGLPTPRSPAERQKDHRVADAQGKDVSAAFEGGAQQALRVYTICGCGCALLKARSPSCGAGWIYDGTFSGTLVPGDGVLAELLKTHGVPVFTEDTLDAMEAHIRRAKRDNHHE